MKWLEEKSIRLAPIEKTRQDEAKSGDNSVLAELREYLRGEAAADPERIMKDHISALNLAFRQVVRPMPAQEIIKETFQSAGSDEAPEWRCSLLLCLSGQTFIASGKKKKDAKRKAASTAVQTLLEDDGQTTNSKKEDKLLAWGPIQRGSVHECTEL